MLDIEVFTAPTQTGLDIVSLAEMKVHLRIASANTAKDDEITAAILAAADKLHGLEGELNRSIFPTTWVRYLEKFPAGGIIRLPYPNLISFNGIEYDNGGSPLGIVSPGDYVVRRRDGIDEVVLLPSADWPDTIEHPRAVAVYYTAGYTTYPQKLKQFVKILAAHYLENKEATINEPRQMMVNRAVMFGVDDFRSALRVPVSYDDWVES